MLMSMGIEESAETVAPFIALAGRVAKLEAWVEKAVSDVARIADHWESVNRQMEDHATRERRERWHATYNSVIGPMMVAMLGEDDDSVVVDLETAHATAEAAANRAHGELTP